MMESREPKRGRFLSEAKPPGVPADLGRALREASQVVRQIFRIGTTLPPRVHGPLQGEVQLYVPFVNFRRGKGEWNEPPQTIEVRGKWWGEEQGMSFQPKVILHTAFMTKDPATAANTCLYPVMVDPPLLTAYLTDMNRLVLEVVDTEHNRVVAQAKFPLSERVVKIRRVPMYATSNTSDPNARGPYIGDLFIQMLVRQGSQSYLRRVVSAAVACTQQDQGQAVQSLLQGLAPSDRDVLNELITVARQNACPPLTLDILDSPAKDSKKDHKDQLLTFQLNEAMAYADASNSLPIWPTRPQQLYTSPESQGQLVQPGQLQAPPPPPPPATSTLPQPPQPPNVTAPPQDEEMLQRRSSTQSRAQEHLEPMVAEDEQWNPVYDSDESGLAASAPPAPMSAPPPSKPVTTSSALPRRRSSGTITKNRRRSDGGSSRATVTGLGKVIPPASNVQQQQLPALPQLPPSTSNGSHQPACMAPSGPERALDDLIARGRQLRETMIKASETTRVALGRVAPGLADLVEGDLGPPSPVPLAAGEAEALPSLADLAYNRLPGMAVWPLLEAANEEVGEASDEEDDLIRTLLQGGDPKAFQMKSRFPALAAAERSRLEALDAVRFLTVGLPSVVLLSVPSLPRRFVVHYRLPPKVVAPIYVEGSTVRCGFNPIDARDRRGRIHAGTFCPESPSPQNPICLALDMNDELLSAWLETSLHLELAVTKGQLYPDKKTRAQVAGDDNDEMVVASADMPLRDLIMSPHLMLNTTLELNRTDLTPSSWKTREDPNASASEAFIGTVNIECSLVSVPVSQPARGPQATVGVSVAPNSAASTASSRVIQPPAPEASMPTQASAARREDDMEADVFLHIGRLSMPPAPHQSMFPRAKAVRLKFCDLSHAFIGPEASARAKHELTATGPSFDFHHDIAYHFTLCPSTINRLQRSHQVFEVWGPSPTRGESGVLLGLVKIPLSGLAIQLRGHTPGADDPLPLWAADGAQEVINPFTGQQCGTLDVSLSVGNERQVHNLQRVRRPLVAFQAHIRGFLRRKHDWVRPVRLDRIQRILITGSRQQPPSRATRTGPQDLGRDDKDFPRDMDGFDKGGRCDGRAPQPSSPPPTSPGAPAVQLSPSSLDDQKDDLSLEGSHPGLVKHTLDLMIQGVCPLTGPGLMALEESGDGTHGVYVRYFVKKAEHSTVLGNAAPGKHDSMLEYRGPRPDAVGAEQSVCLWWDVESAFLNSKARHVLLIEPPESIEDQVCDDEGVHFEVWVCQKGATSINQLIGTALLPRPTLTRLLRQDVGHTTVRLKVQAVDPPSDLHVGAMEVALTYCRESRPLVGASHTELGSPPTGRRHLMRGARPTTRDDTAKLLYSESTVVDRLLPARGFVCVHVLEHTGLPQDIPQLLQQLRPDLKIEPDSSLVIRYAMATGSEADEGQRSHSSTWYGDLESIKFLDEIPICINAAFVERVYADVLIIELGLAAPEDTTDSQEIIQLATLRVVLAPLLTDMGGIYGSFPWTWLTTRGAGVKLGEAKVAIYFKHRQRYSAAESPRGTGTQLEEEAGGGKGDTLGDLDSDDVEGGGGAYSGGDGAGEDVDTGDIVHNHHDVEEEAVTPPRASSGGYEGEKVGVAESIIPPLASPLLSPTRRPSPSRLPISSPLVSPSVTSLPQKPPSPPVGLLTVTIEEAKHLRPPASWSSLSDRTTDWAGENIFVTYEWGKQVTVTPPVPFSPAPIWDHTSTIDLASYRSLCEAVLVLQIWQRQAYLDLTHGESSPIVSDWSSVNNFTGLRFGDVLLGRATIDLSTMAAGMRELCGWYHIHDSLQKPRGQLKVCIQLKRLQDESPQMADRKWKVPVGSTDDEAWPLQGGGGGAAMVPPMDSCRLADLAVESLDMRESVLSLGSSVDGGMSPGAFPSLDLLWASRKEEELGDGDGLEAIQNILRGLDNLNEGLLAHLGPSTESSGDVKSTPEPSPSSWTVEGPDREEDLLPYSPSTADQESFGHQHKGVLDSVLDVLGRDDAVQHEAASPGETSASSPGAVSPSQPTQGGVEVVLTAPPPLADVEEDSQSTERGVEVPWTPSPELSPTTFPTPPGDQEGGGFSTDIATAIATLSPPADSPPLATPRSTSSSRASPMHTYVETEQEDEQGEEAQTLAGGWSPLPATILSGAGGMSVTSSGEVDGASPSARREVAIQTEPRMTTEEERQRESMEGGGLCLGMSEVAQSGNAFSDDHEGRSSSTGTGEDELSITDLDTDLGAALSPPDEAGQQGGTSVFDRAADNIPWSAEGIEAAPMVEVPPPPLSPLVDSEEEQAPEEEEEAEKGEEREIAAPVGMGGGGIGGGETGGHDAIGAVALSVSMTSSSDILEVSSSSAGESLPAPEVLHVAPPPVHQSESLRTVLATDSSTPTLPSVEAAEWAAMEESHSAEALSPDIRRTGLQDSHRSEPLSSPSSGQPAPPAFAMEASTSTSGSNLLLEESRQRRRFRQRFADSETERIARIMMGKFQQISRSGC